MPFHAKERRGCVWYSAVWGRKTRTRTHDAFAHKNVACSISEKWRKRSIIPFVGENCFLFRFFLRVHHLWESRLLREKTLKKRKYIIPFAAAGAKAFWAYTYICVREKVESNFSSFPSFSSLRISP